MKKRICIIMFLAAALGLSACGASSLLESGLASAQEELSSAATELSSAAEEISSAVEEISSAAEGFSDRPDDFEGVLSELTGSFTGLKDPVTIVYTNDIHCQTEGDIGYRGVVLVREALAAAGENVLLVDSGDHIQGDVVGSLSKGENIIRLMNAAKYDVACLGNHEFDYGIEQQKKLVSMAEYPYVCCNFADQDGKLLYDPYKILTVGSTKVAFIGILTPATIQGADPKFFKDEKGNYIYDLYVDASGDRLVEQVQKTVDEARAAGADYVIALAHLGIEGACSPFTSSELIPRLSGIDAYLDGHSHTMMEREEVTDKDGKKVLLTQTGTKLANIGILKISETGEITNRLVNNEDISGKIEEVTAQVSEVTKQVVAHSESDLVIYDPVEKDEYGSPIRLVRRMETNLGDLCADAQRWSGQSDIGFINGGGVRVDVPAGDITIADIMKVQPFGNMYSVVEIDGQTLLYMLEYGVSYTPEEFGGFPQVSGVSFDVDLTVESSIKVDGEKVTVEGEYRVQNVKVGGEPLELQKKYTLTGNAFILSSGGDGYSFLPSMVTPVRENFAVDIDCTLDYLQNALGGKVGQEYADPYGQGRIRMITE